MILVIMGRMMVLEALLNIQLALLHINVNRINHPLHRTHTSDEVTLEKLESESKLHQTRKAEEQSVKMMLQQASQHEWEEAKEAHLGLLASAMHLTSLGSDCRGGPISSFWALLRCLYQTA
jgi:hypothetical protein